MKISKRKLTGKSGLAVLPATHIILGDPRFQEEAKDIAEVYRTRLVQGVLSGSRTKIRKQPEGHRDGARLREEIISAAIREARALLAPFPRRVINGTGIIIHTNLGRAPLGDALNQVDQGGIRGYCNLEWDAETQKRGSRDQHIRGLLCLLTGAESALAVNNCAGALFLALHTLARGKNVLVSRSELVEIGGGFRIPEIMETSGCRLLEVGTTNKTRLRDYQKHAKSRQSVLMKVHQSNFVQRGFVESVPLGDLVALGRRHRIPVIYDTGSGLLAGAGAAFLKDEPAVTDSLKQGIGVVVCSADKLFGSIQAGLIFGKAPFVDPIRRNPLYRALRLDKVRMALLDYALKQHLSAAPRNLPTERMLTAESPELESCKQTLRLPGESTRWQEVRWVTLQASVGGGSNPEVGFASLGLKLVHREHSPGSLKASFARYSVPILGYVHGGVFHLDIRTFFPDDFPILQKVLDELSQ